jgi:protein-disulfide isomerase
MLQRRAILFSALAGAIAFPALAQSPDEKKLLASLLEPGALPDKTFGSDAAPVTIIEYASITCHFCMKFHTETWPDLKAKYVDTGQVRFIMRELPLDPLATAGFMLARCMGDDKWYAMLDLLYRTKETWGHAANPSEALLQTVRQGGFTQESFEACLQNEKLFRDIRDVADRGSREFGVNATPTFFINGIKHTGALTLQQFDAILFPLLKPKT